MTEFYYLLVTEEWYSGECEKIIHSLANNLADGIKLYLKKISNYHDDVPPNRAELRSEIDLNNSIPVWDFSCFNKRKCPHYNYVICKRKKADNTYAYLLKMKLGESRPLGNYKMRMGFIVYEDEVDFDNYKDYDKMSLESDEEYSSRLQRDAVQEHISYLL